MPTDPRSGEARSFGLPDELRERRLTYGGYLKVPQLLALQELLSDPAQHDETLFIIIHQVYELWFKQLLHEVDALLERLERDEVLGAHHLLQRCVSIQRVLVSQVSVLETMTPVDFLAFRDHLTPASGFQSAQFRELEFVSGMKNPKFVEHYDAGSEERARLEARLARPSLDEAFYALLRRRGFQLPEDPAGEDEEEADAVRDQRRRELLRIYHERDQHYALFLLTESLMDYDEQFTLWRLRHVLMVERMIGSKPGTGGSAGASYLRRTAERRFFPELWEMRSFLSHKGAEY